tara:strand:+ start:455 stop:658 length:204 start_codon:yes stop_codon:yes gene_type:complete
MTLGEEPWKPPDEKHRKKHAAKPKTPPDEKHRKKHAAKLKTPPDEKRRKKPSDENQFKNSVNADPRN